MKPVIICILLSLLLSFKFPGEIYQFSIHTIDGKEISLDNYKGKKLLFITLSPNLSDSSLHQLMAFRQKYSSDSLAIIGIPALEDGFTRKSAYAVYKTVNRDDISLIISEPVNVRKTASQQVALFFWLTHVENNRHFNNDVTSPGQKFFLDESGILYAVMSQRQSLNGPTVQKIVNRPLPVLPASK